MEEDNQDPFELTSVELNKKRKLQEDQLVLPSPKHKYTERSCDTENESLITDDNKVEDNTDGSQNDSACGRVEPCELVIESNSFIEESDNAMSVEAEAAPKLLTETNYLDLPSISSSSSTNNCRSDYWSPASKIIESGEHLNHVRNIDANLATLGDGLQLGQGLPCSEDRLMNFK